MLNEYIEIEKRLEEEFLAAGKEREYRDMLELIVRIADYILDDAEIAKKGMGEIMGGRVLELESDRLIKQGFEKGVALEREKTERERKRAEAAEAENKRLRALLEARK